MSIKPVTTVITITEKVENGYIKHTIEENGTLLFQQRKPVYMVCKADSETFLDKFLKCLNVSSCQLKRGNDAFNIIDDGSNLFYFISQRRLQSLNFKQKFFHFLLKKIFLHGKSSAIEQIKGRLMNNQEK